MASNNNFDNAVDALFQGLNKVLTTKTVVGEPQIIGDTTIVPLVDVSFGMGAGAAGKEGKNSNGGGMGGKMSPSAILVIKDGKTKLVNIRNQEALTKILDMIPDSVNAVTSMIKGRGKDENSEESKQVDAAIYQQMHEQDTHESMDPISEE
ncbi:MAG: GerW family sporulation protein [Lachnospiraceae bacterium]|nr:GerW family sporulation protein [Lachnospiraceae bacterium]